MSAPAIAAPTTADHRDSPFPNGAMIMTRFMELRRRRGLMITLVAVTIGLPAIFLIVRLIAHAVAPHSYGPAGGYAVYENLVAGVIYVFGFIVAATLGCTAGSVDLSEGVFRHLVVTGRSRLALYFARIPAGLMIIVPLITAGVFLVSLVCVAAAPTRLNFEGINNVPVGLSRTAFVSWAEAHPQEAICDMGFRYKGPMTTSVQCGRGNRVVVVTQTANTMTTHAPTPAQELAQAKRSAEQNYRDYTTTFLSPPLSLMLETWLWVLLWAVLGFLVGLGLSSLMGQRTVPIVILIVYEIVLTPIFSRVGIPHLINAQRALLGTAMANIEPSKLPPVFGGNSGGGMNQMVHESTTIAVVVIVGWFLVWTALGAWRMATRDA